MNTRKGSGRLLLLTCTTAALGATSLAGCTLEQVAANPVESAGKAFSSFFDFANFTVDPDTIDTVDFDLDFPAE